MKPGPHYEAIAVPARLTRLHPAVATLRERPTIKGMRASVRSRALRILQAVATEAERRGFSATCTQQPRDGALTVVAHAHSYPIALREMTTRTEHQATAAEITRKQRQPWTRIAEYDYTPNGELELSLPRSWNGRPRVFADTRRWRVETRLARLMAEVEFRVDSDWRRAQERAAAEQRNREAHALAIADAKRRLIDCHRADALAGQVSSWQLAKDIRALCAAVRASRSESGDSPDSAEDKWIAWAESHADNIDPIRQLFVAPATPRAEGESLRPFLGTWSPYLGV